MEADGAATQPPAQLPDDVIQFNILPGLPFPVLARLAAVCRSWRDLILRDPAFAAQLARTPSPASVSVSVAVFHYRRFRLPGYAAAAAEPPDPKLSFLPFQKNLPPARLHRGRPLLQRVAIGAHHPRVVNPATREFRSVPFDRDGHGHVTVSLAYDPAVSSRPPPTVAGDEEESLAGSI